jgi:DNA-damage-inducible protein D
MDNDLILNAPHESFEKLKKERIKGEGRASFTHIVVGQKVRKSIKDIGGTMPEDLPPEPHIKEIKKKLPNTSISKLLKV